MKPLLAVGGRIGVTMCHFGNLESSKSLRDVLFIWIKWSWAYFATNQGHHS